jgi:multidrug efflux pump
VLASGAGSAAQRAIGDGVVGGMIAATVLGVIFVPVFFVVVRRLFKGSERQRRMYAHENLPVGAADGGAAGGGS